MLTFLVLQVTEAFCISYPQTEDSTYSDFRSKGVFLL